MTEDASTPHIADEAAPGPADIHLLISELYRSIQGESSYAGQPCSFIRLTGCPLRCVWCDSAFAFKGGQWMTGGEILTAVAGFALPLVEVTGGEPLVQPGCPALLRELCDAGYRVLLETSGALDITPVDPRVIKIIDLKCPGSGEEHANRWDNLDHLAPHDELKFVLASREDYEWAADVLHRYKLAGTRPIHLSTVFGKLEPAQVAQWMLEDHLNVRLQLQLHKFIWPGVTQGI